MTRLKREDGMSQVQFDADLDEVVAGAAAGAFATQGEM